MNFQANAVHIAAQAEGCHERAAEYGERAWRIKGNNADVIYWDVGIGWSSIITVISHTGGENQLVEFWQRLLDVAPNGELEEDDAE